MTVFPDARAMRVVGHVPGITTTELIASSKDSYHRPTGRTDDESQPGPAILAAALDGNRTGSLVRLSSNGCA